MVEILWHGRGGQGAFTAARLLGAAASLAEGVYALAFPSFGPERRGAPMKAFTKIADAAIGDRSAVTRADFVVYLDDTLLGANWADELKPGGKVLVNSIGTFADERIVALDADGISKAILGRAIPNTVFLGALSVLCEQIDVADVQEAVRQYMPEKLHAKNLAIVDKAVRLMCLDGMRDVGAGAEHAGDAGSSSACELVCEGNDTPSLTQSCSCGAAKHVSEEETRLVNAADSSCFKGDEGNCADVCCAEEGSGSGVVRGENSASREHMHIPSLRVGQLHPEVFARSTCFEAGYLTTKNAGWRNARPVVDLAVCTGCLQCYMYCPDGTIFKVDAASDDKRASLVAVDYDFCKGCGVCASVCLAGAIGMVSEKEALAVEDACVEKSEVKAR